MNWKKISLNAIKYLLFLAVGIFIFWLVYKDLEVEKLKSELQDLRWGWIVLSFFLGMFSHVSRAYRWNMLIKPMGYQPIALNSFLSIMVMYFTNLLLPRAGEVARCTVLSKYEKIPFSKLLGTVIVERTTDLLALAFFAVLIIIHQFDIFSRFMNNHPEFQERFIQLLSMKNIFIFIGILMFLVIIFYVFRASFRKTKIYVKIRDLIRNFVDGIKTIRKLEKTWLYIAHTVFIYFMWLVMLYVVFFSFEPTEDLSIFAGMLAFVTSGLAMIAPVQAGIGPWHFMVIETLFLYGLDRTNGQIFALIAHSATNLSLMVMGIISLALLPLINKKR